MEIIVAMVLTILQFLMNVLQACLLLGAVGTVLTIIGIAASYIHQWRNPSITTSDECYFEEPYVQERSDKVLVPAEWTQDYYRELADNRIFENTEEL